MKEMVEKSLDPQLWQACAGGMVNIPPKNSKVFYFPQGHAEHAQSHVDFPAAARIPASILCRVASLKFMADPDSDEVFAKITLIPLGNGDLDLQDDPAAVPGDDPAAAVAAEKPASFAKTLTQSDANNGGGFSVPRYCAETIFPRLDYAADPPVQNVVARDVHGGVWKFRHIYRGTPRRHLLTTGWSNFVNQKKLVAGDSIVFLRTQTGEICVGIRRAKRGVSGDPHPVWNNAYGSGGGGLGRKVRPEAVAEAAVRASEGRAFEAVYYPRLSTPEFCVRASAVEAAMRVQWCSGMRFKMAFETEDSSRISWFMGTVGSVHVADPIRWPRSPWRLLQVAWDEPDLLQNVKRVNPWLIESVSNVPLLHLSSFSPPRKKLRLDNTNHHHHHFPSPSPAPPYPLPFPPPPPMSMSMSIGPPFFGNSITAPPAGIQGARHALFGISLSDLHHRNHNSFPAALHHHHHQAPPGEALSCVLTMGRPSEADRPLQQRPPQQQQQHGLVLFGQPILTEQQISDKASSDLFGLLETGHCKVFRESEDVGRTLDLTTIQSYEELYRRLAHMFGLERSEMPTHVLYHDAAGVLKTTADEPFSDFVKTAKRLSISTDSSSKNNARMWITGMRNAENGLGASNKTGPLSIFA